MNYSNKTNKKWQASSKFKSASEALIDEQKIVNQENKDIKYEMAQLGYKVSIEEFLQIKPDIDNDKEGSAKLLELQQRCKKNQERKAGLDNIICIEPSKLPEAVDAAEKLLVRDSEFYQRNGKLVRVVKVAQLSEYKSSWINRKANDIVIRELDQAYLMMQLTKLGNFIRLDPQNGKINKMDCPEKVVRCLISKQEWDLPILTGIINAPTLRSDGTIISKLGYDKASGLLLVNNDILLKVVSDNVSMEDAKKAKDELLFVLKDFPFENEVSKSVAIAAILTALIRRSISTAPLFGFTAPKMASGKSLLADIVALIATGKPNSVIPQAENEAEEKKRLMALLMEGDPVICYDNIERPFGSAALCSVLTQKEYKDRMLGTNETRTVFTNSTFLATGNNLTFIGDISTRTLLCKLDAQIERPEERAFEIDLHKFIPENRAQLVNAGLTMLKAYDNAGRPKQEIKQFGRFEQWSDWIRSTVIWLGMEDPCKSRTAIEDTDPVRLLLSEFYQLWYGLFGDKAMKAIDLIAGSQGESNEQRLLRDCIQELSKGTQGNIDQRILAKKLSRYKGRIENGLKLEDAGKNQGTTLWRIRKIQD